MTTLGIARRAGDASGTTCRYDPSNGTLVAPADVIRAHAAGHLSGLLLAELGAVRDGVVHERLRPTLAALRDPVHGTLQLAYKGRALDGWHGAETVALLTPADEHGNHTLAPVSAPRLPTALATVAALEPRPVAAGPTTTHALRAASDVVRWWRLVHGPTRASAGGLLEVVDTRSGLFIVGHDESAIPTDAASVEHLIRWLVAGRDVLQPLRVLPLGMVLPQAAPTASMAQDPSLAGERRAPVERSEFGA